MRKVTYYPAFVFILTVLVLFTPACKKQEPPVEEQQEAVTEEKIQLKILYAGHPGSEREKDFIAFLRGKFAEVGTGDMARFDGSQSKDFDITILDYDGEGFNAPRPNISHDYSAPTMTMGVPGAFICGTRAFKMDYL
jgi:hypothetical protein